MKKEDALDKLFKGYYKDRPKNGPVGKACYDMMVSKCECKPMLRQDKTSCPDIAAISAYINQSLDLQEKKVIEDHIAYCAACRDSVDAARLAMTDLQNKSLPKAPGLLPPALPPHGIPKPKKSL